jgi:KRAB domain-containing zinc finger protein
MNGHSNDRPPIQKHLPKRNIKDTYVECSFFGCHRRFTDSYYLKEHLARHTGVKPNACQHCEKTFLRNTEMESHILRVHTKEKRFTCPDCNWTGYTQGDLIRHESTHTKPHECPECNRRFTSNQFLQEHLQKHKGERPHQCQYCSKPFPTPRQVKSHETRVHLKQARYACPDCNWRGFLPSELRRHTITHTQERPYVCGLDNCEDAFFSQRELTNHQTKTRKHGGTTQRQKNVCCQATGCDWRGHVPSELEVHIRAKHSGERPFVCLLGRCGKTFASEKRLKAHQKTRIHQGNKQQYKCFKCDNNFANEQNLKVHLKQHTEERLYPCGFCKSRFKAEKDVSLHEKRVHRKLKPFACSQCNWKGCGPYELKIHTMKHSGERPYACPLDGCGKTFPSQAWLNKHLKTKAHNSKDYISTSGTKCSPSMPKWG